MTGDYLFHEIPTPFRFICDAPASELQRQTDQYQIQSEVIWDGATTRDEVTLTPHSAADYANPPLDPAREMEACFFPLDEHSYQCQGHEEFMPDTQAPDVLSSWLSDADPLLPSVALCQHTAMVRGLSYQSIATSSSMRSGRSTRTSAGQMWYV